MNMIWGLSTRLIRRLGQVRRDLLPGLAAVGAWSVFFLGYWLLQRYALSTLTLPGNIDPADITLRTTAIDFPLIGLFVSGASLRLVQQRWTRIIGWLLYPMLFLVLALNTANYLIAAEFGRSLTRFDLSYVTDQTFLSGSVLPTLLSPAVFFGVVLPLLLFVALMYGLRRVRRPVHVLTVLLLVAVLCLPAFYIRRWGYCGTVHRTYAASQSLYFDSLLKGRLSRQSLTEEESGEFIRARAGLFFDRVTPSVDTELPDSVKRRNIILVIMESFAYSMVTDTFRGKRVAPAIHGMARQGLELSRFYANSWRSSRALWSIYSGELDRIHGLIFLNNPQNTLPFISDILRADGYYNCWFHGNHAAWDNRANMLERHGFEGVFGREAYPDDSRATGWGICDRDFFRHTFHKLDSIAGNNQPFFATVLSLSNHHPYEFPDSTGLFANPDEDPFVSALNGHRYADMALGRFCDSLRTRPWFGNTFLLVTADNGSLCGRRAATVEDRIERLFHIPCILQGPGIPRAVRDSTLASQIDLAPTILNLAGRKTARYGLGEPIFARPDSGFVPIVAPSRAALVAPGGISTAAYHEVSAERSAAGAHLLQRYQSLWSRLIAGGQERVVLGDAMGENSPALTTQLTEGAMSQSSER